MNHKFSKNEICRLCGKSGEKKKHLFSIENKSLLKTVLTVFPIIMYPSDPLPKQICSQCINFVTYAHKNMSKMFNLQTKWIEEEQLNHPNNEFNRIIDFIKKSNTSTMNTVKEKFGIDLSLNPLQPLPTNATNSQNVQLLNENCIASSHRYVTRKKNSCTMKTIDKKIEEQPTTSMEIMSLVDEEEINIPESEENVPLAEIMVKKKTKLNQTNIPESEENVPLAEIIVKKKRKLNQSNIPESEENVPLAEIIVKKKSKLKQKDLKCRICQSIQPTAATLAIHQAKHLKVRLTKSFGKKILDKSMHCAQSIRANSKIFFRCLSCWRDFNDNKAITQHWKQGDCEFFCMICNKKFPLEPKKLREHIPAAHGISYRSLKRIRLALNQNKQKNSDNTCTSFADNLTQQSSLPKLSIKDAIRPKGVRIKYVPPRNKSTSVEALEHYATKTEATGTKTTTSTNSTTAPIGTKVTIFR